MSSQDPESSLSSHNITIGGIANVGNTCIFSVLLQEFAALPSYYDFFLTTPLVRQPTETEFGFQLRKRLQDHLNKCVQKVRFGEAVTVKDVHPIALIALQFGWQQKKMNLLNRVLYHWAPRIFPMPAGKPTKLHSFLLSLLINDINDSPKTPVIIGLGKGENAVTYQEAFENCTTIQSCQNVALCRLIHSKEQIKETVILPERIETQDRSYSLQMVHVFKETKIGHVIAYRKVNDQWICCDDAKVYAVKALPLNNIYGVVYASQPNKSW